MNPKRLLIVSITFLSGLYFILEFLLPEKVGGYQFGKYHEQIMLGVRVVGSMAFGLGIINIAQVHGARVLRLQKDWENSLALILGFLLMLSVGAAQFFTSLKNTNSVEELDHMKDFVQHVEEERLAEKMAIIVITPTPAQSRIRSMLPVIERHELRWQSILDTVKNEPVTKDSAGLPTNAPQIEKIQAILSELGSIKTQSVKLSEAYAALSHKQAVENTDGIINPLIESIKNAAQNEREASETLTESSFAAKLSQLLYSGFFVSLGSAMFSLLAFYISSAAYRAFRVRSLEASILMITATLMILGQIPQGRMYISENLPLVRLWLLKNVNTPGNRAIYFGSAIAGLAMAVRMWLSLERSPLDSSGEGES